MAVFYALCLFPLKHFFHGAFLGNLTSCSDLHHVNHYDKCRHEQQGRSYRWCGGYVDYYPINTKRRNILYVFARVFETFMGVFVAILVNYDIEQLKLFWEKKKKNNVTFYDIIR